jgi:putative flippase GtrA
VPNIASHVSTFLDYVRDRSGRPVRYLIAGGFNAFLGLTFYPALIWTFPIFHKMYMLALVISQIFCTTVAFIVYKLGVFKTKGNIFREFWSFSAFYLINYVVNYACLPILVEIAGLSPIIAQWIFVAALAISSYLWHSRISFRQSPD